MSDFENKVNSSFKKKKRDSLRPSNAFVGVSWVVLLLGIVCYCIGLWNAISMQLNEKGYFITILLFGLFSIISVQKCVRDRLDNIPVTDVYYGLSWFCSIVFFKI